MEKFACPNPWRDKDVYVDFLSDAVRLFFEDSIYWEEPEYISLYIRENNIWTILVARHEAKSELSYYKVIGFTQIGQYQYDKWEDEKYFAVNKELLWKFVDESFDSVS